MLNQIRKGNDKARNRVIEARISPVLFDARSLNTNRINPERLPNRTLYDTLFCFVTNVADYKENRSFNRIVYGVRSKRTVNTKFNGSCSLSLQRDERDANACSHVTCLLTQSELGADSGSFSGFGNTETVYLDGTHRAAPPNRCNRNAESVKTQKTRERWADGKTPARARMCDVTLIAGDSGTCIS